MALPSVRDIALDPEWIPHAFDADGRHLTSVFVPRSARAGLVFLTDGQFRGEYQKVTVPVGAVAAESDAATEAPVHFIFHTSFCCSTLLARAFDIAGVATSLREPNILVDVAERLIRADEPANRDKLDVAVRLLARPLAAGEKVIIKPSSFANRLIEPLLSLRPGSCAILLYSDAATYLRSLVRRGLLARINGRKLYRNLTAWTALDFGFSSAETFEQTDLQIAALAWLMQIAHFNAVAERCRDRVMVLDAAELIADPDTALRRVQSLFGLGLSHEDIGRIVAGPAFSKHSKFSDLDYDSTAREQDHEALMKVHADELGMVLQWLNAVAAHLRVPLKPEAAPQRS